MSTKEIPREKWTEFFDGFSQRHEGWLVNVQVLGDSGAQTEVRELPLTGISADRDAARTISILVGDSPDVNVERLPQDCLLLLGECAHRDPPLMALAGVDGGSQWSLLVGSVHFRQAWSMMSKRTPAPSRMRTASPSVRASSSASRRTPGTLAGALSRHTWSVPLRA